MKRIVRVIFPLLLLLILISACTVNQTLSDVPVSPTEQIVSTTQTATDIPEGALLTIEGYPVPEEEFRLFLNDQKAVTANYFWTTYQIQPNSTFWTTSVNGETPIDYAKQRALDALIKSKVEFIIAAERNVLQYQDYATLMDSMEIENADRAKKQETGEVFYGLTKFTPFTYYQYLNTNLRAELEYAQREISKPTDAELQRIYDANYDMFSLGIVYEYEVVFEDGTHEFVTQSNLEIGKEDYTTEDLIAHFDEMELSGSIANYDYRGQSVEIILHSKTPKGYVSLEDARESLHNLFAREELSALIQSRAKATKVEFDQVRFHAIEKP